MNNKLHFWPNMTIYSIYKKHVSMGHSMIFSRFMK